MVAVDAGLVALQQVVIADQGGGVGFERLLVADQRTVVAGQRAVVVFQQTLVVLNADDLRCDLQAAGVEVVAESSGAAALAQAVVRSTPDVVIAVGKPVQFAAGRRTNGRQSGPLPVHHVHV